MIDTTFCFIDDAGGRDPDLYSKTLYTFHSQLYSRRLPCGLEMNLNEKLEWNGFRFGNDSITVSYRKWKKAEELMSSVRKAISDFDNFINNYSHSSYTIGGEIIFPRHNSSINQMRGTNPLLADRFDLALECIRRFYIDEPSPLSKTLERDRVFFELFVDFKGYVDFFFLNNYVSNGSVCFFFPTVLFQKDPIPTTVDDYLKMINSELELVNARNNRIQKFIQTHMDYLQSKDRLD